MLCEWVDFGQVSAERDENLSEYFYDNGILDIVIKNKYHFLVLGRKGAGKTAVFRYFSYNYKKYVNENDLVVSLSLQDYNWNVHGLLSSAGKSQSIAYVQSWKYVIYILAIRALLERYVSLDDLSQAKSIIDKIYETKDPGIGKIIGEKLLRLVKLKLPSAGFNIDEIDISADAGEIAFSDVQKDEILKNSLNKTIERIVDIFECSLIKAMKGTGRIFVTFDRIDEAWDSASFESSQRIISGLIGASETIVSRFDGKLRPIVFIREDIFETLDINDKNKLRSDCGQLLSWNKNGISRVILKRINYFARKSGNSEFVSIDDIFDRNQMRQQRAPLDYILLRTMLRPRDFIKMFLLIKANMQQRFEDPFDDQIVSEDKLECQSIYNSEPAYSEWLIEELRDEWRAQFPMINKLFSAIQNNGKTNFTHQDIFNSLKNVDASIVGSDIINLLKFLYDNSVIGFRIGKSQQWKFKCFSTSQGFIESDIYKVHDGLHRGLNLTESRAVG